MASLLTGEASFNGASSQEKIEEDGAHWYFSRKDIEENSPSRLDGIDLKKETYLRKSYCTLLQDLGMRLKVPQVTIATAIIFCHRFFHRQSHSRNDRRTIATVCMFLAGKVEETPRPLKDVILVSYEIIHKKDPAAVQRIKQKEIYEQQKELILLGERVVLGTLGYDLNVHHPYKPLVEAIKKFKVAQNALAQVAWNFVNDGLRTSLCLQFKPHHIAAGAIFLAAKFLKVKLPSDGEKVWWQEFDVTPRQLEEVSNQMLELYEQQNRVPPSQVSEERPPSKVPANEERGTSYSSSHGGSTSKGSSLKPASSSRPGPTDELNAADNHPPKTAQTQNSNNFVGEDEINDVEENKRAVEDDQEGNSGRIEVKDKDKLQNKDGTVTVGQSPQEGKNKLDTEKLKAAFKNRKARGDITRKVDPLDELERELEDVEVPSEKRERKQTWSNGDEFDNVEEGEVGAAEEFDRGVYRSNRKRKPGGSPPLDRNRLGRIGYSERDHKRQLQENHV